jgi:hypothetical protein
MLRSLMLWEEKGLWPGEVEVSMAGPPAPRAEPTSLALRSQKHDEGAEEGQGCVPRKTEDRLESMRCRCLTCRPWVLRMLPALEGSRAGDGEAPAPAVVPAPESPLDPGTRLSSATAREGLYVRISPLPVGNPRRWWSAFILGVQTPCWSLHMNIDMFPSTS